MTEEKLEEILNFEKKIYVKYREINKKKIIEKQIPIKTDSRGIPIIFDVNTGILSFELMKSLQDYINDINSMIEKLNETKIKELSWWKNLIDFYIPIANKIWNAYSDSDEKEIDEIFDSWLRKDEKAFYTEVEKFIKWYMWSFFDKKYVSKFDSAINYLPSIIKQFPLKSNNIKDAEKEEELYIYDTWRELWIWKRFRNTIQHDNDEEKNYLALEDGTIFFMDANPIYKITSIFMFINHLLIILIRIKLIDEYELENKIKPLYHYENLIMDENYNKNIRTKIKKDKN